MRENEPGPAHPDRPTVPEVVELRKTNAQLREQLDAAQSEIEALRSAGHKTQEQLEAERHERKQLEETVYEREGRLRLALAAGRMGTWDLDVQVGEAFIDAQEAELLGFHPHEQHISLETFFDLVHPDDRRRKVELFQQGEDYQTEFRIVRPDGETRWLVATTTFVHNEQGKIVRAIGVNFDITARKQAETRLREAKAAAETAARAKSEFLANMSHEIRTPLTSIIGFTSFLAERLTGKELQYIQMIQRNGKRLSDTLNSILMLARLESNSIEVDFEPVRVAEEVDRVVEFYRSEAEEKGVTIEHTIDRDARRAHVRLDPDALNSILQNLISNAIKFTDEGSVRVRTFVSSAEEPASSLHVRIADTGCGIEEKSLQRIFRSFEQESKGNTRSYEGSGLGLSISKQLTELMNGTLEVESEKHEGSTFTLTFPVATQRSATSVEPAPSRGASPSSGARILAVEDHPETNFLLQNLLPEIGAPTVVSTAEEALSQARASRFDLVLLDIQLGASQSGVDLMKSLRALPAYEEVPIVALTAHAFPSDEEDFLRKGFDAYMSKPFMADDLLTLLQEQLQNGRAAS